LNGPQSDPFHYIYSSRGWLTDYDPPGPFPFFLNLEPTNACQLDCLFCSRQMSERPLGRVDLGTAAALMDEVARHPGTAVRFTGWGEPLLHPQIDELVKIVKERGIPLKIYTNGLALTDALTDAILALEVDDLQFSMQGLNEKQYLFNRVGGDYEKLCRNIERVSRKRGGQKKPFLSILTSVLADELEEESPEDFTAKWLGTVDKVGVDLTNLNFVRHLDRLSPHLGRQSAGLRRGRCVDVFLALEVKYDGLIQYCGQDSRSLPEHVIGRFPEMTLSEAWLGEAMEERRNKVGRALGHEQFPVCRNCYHNTDKYDAFKKRLSGGQENGQ
jgi:organic radical activating enzyme